MKRVVVKVGTHVLSEQNRLCKERILNLITDAHQKYFEITQFFLDPSMSRSEKELKAYHFLENEILHLEFAHIVRQMP